MMHDVTADTPTGANLLVTHQDGRQRLSTPRAAEELVRLLDVKRAGRQPRPYRAGAWTRDDGRIDEAIRDLLGDRYTENLRREIWTYLSRFADVLPAQDHPDLIVFGNVTVNTVTGDILPHSPDHRLTVRLHAEYHRDAPLEQVNAFLNDIVPEEFAARLREAGGLALSPWRDLQIMFWGRGLPGSGKSTFARLLTAVMGGENVGAVEPQAFGSSMFALSSLVGKRLNIVADASARDLSSLKAIKAITGQDLVQVEEKYQPSYAVRLDALLFFMSNSFPSMSDPDGALMRRVKPITFERHSSGQPDPALSSNLSTPENLSALALVFLNALWDVRHHGLTENTATKKALKEFRRETNTVALFLDEECIFETGSTVKRSQLWDAFRSWSDDSRKGSKIGKNAFLRTLQTDHGVIFRKSDDWLADGVRLRRFEPRTGAAT